MLCPRVLPRCLFRLTAARLRTRLVTANCKCGIIQYIMDLRHLPVLLRQHRRNCNCTSVNWPTAREGGGSLRLELKSAVVSAIPQPEAAAKAAGTSCAMAMAWGAFARLWKFGTAGLPSMPMAVRILQNCTAKSVGGPECHYFGASTH